MSNKSADQKYRNSNRYQHKGVVVLGFHERTVNGDTQVYATGFDLDKPDEMVSVALMQPEGFRKHIAQFQFGLTEKTNGTDVTYYNNLTKKEITEEAYKDMLHNHSGIDTAFNKLMSQRRNAEGLLTKQSRLSQLPAVLMFDNANKLGEVGGMSIYEAKWVNGIAGNTKNDKAADDFTLSHRKVLGNIRVKYDDFGRPVWGDCHAVDRIIDLKSPSPKNTEQEMRDLSERNRDILRYALSNVTASDEGYQAERKPFTYFNLHDKQGQFKETVAIYNEEFSDSRTKQGESSIKYDFMRPKDAPETLEAYMFHQDAFSLDLKQAIVKNEPIDDPAKIEQALKADKARAVISALTGLKFQPLITSELAERAETPELKKTISIYGNTLKSLHKDLVLGDLKPRMVNGTIYPIGPKYLERFVKDVMPTTYGRSKPIAGIVNLEGEGNNMRIRSFNEDRTIPFSPMYISPKKWDSGNDKNPSVFTSFITTPGQSYNEVINSRINHTDLKEEHSPTVDSFRLIRKDYEDYINGAKALPNVFDLMDKEKERILEIKDEQQAIKANEVYCRLLGNHEVKPLEVRAPENNGSSYTPEQDKKKSHEPEIWA